jgi:Domain of unknown function (DUF6456)
MKRPRKPAATENDGPTPERLVRGAVERAAATIADEAGRPSRPYRAIDTLAQMLRRRTISPAMYQAAEDFRALFHRASLDPLSAPDLSRIRGGTAGAEAPLSLRQAAARQRIWTALLALGGIASPAGSCVWHVVGCEWSLKAWAAQRGWGGRPLSQEAASGLLVGALGMLEAHLKQG